MEELDITKKELYIRCFLRVMKSQLHFRGKPLGTRSRASNGFIYVVSGSCSYSFDDDTHVTVKSGDLLYLAYGSSYRMDLLTENYDVIWCVFFFDSEEMRKNDAIPSAGVDTESLFRRLYKIYASLSDDKFQKCLSVLYQIYGIAASIKNTSYIAPDLKQKVQDIASCIMENLQDSDLCVSSLAEQAGMSEVYFRKLFKVTFGCSPAKYITLIRLKTRKRY